MGTNTSVMVEGEVIPLAPPNTWVTQLTAPDNPGPNTLWVYSPLNESETAPSLTLLFAQGFPVEPQQQIQLQPTADGAVDLGAYFGTPQPTGAVNWIGDVGAEDGSGPTWANFTSAAVSPPGVGLTVDAAILDATDAAGLADGAKLCTGGRIYTLDKAASTFASPGTLALVDTGEAGGKFNLIG